MKTIVFMGLTFALFLGIQHFVGGDDWGGWKQFELALMIFGTNLLGFIEGKIDS